MAAHDLSDLLTRAAGWRPERVALLEPEGRLLTWEELDAEVTRVAAGLVSRAWWPAPACCWRSATGSSWW